MIPINFPEYVEYKENELLSGRCSFKTGGAAGCAVYPKSARELCEVTKILKSASLRYILVGNGSNLLFDDRGFDGFVIFTKGINQVEYIHKDGYVFIKAGCGKLLTELSGEVGKKHSLTGFEFAYGIPGTLGGAVYMNAGAYGGQMSDILVESEVYDAETDRIFTISAEEHDFSYRHSIFFEKSSYTVLSSTLKLKEGNAEDIFALMTKHMQSRREKQPLEFPSAGSTFKRPADNVFAGKLIEDAGLKGFTIGGAQVSEKHAGFIINRNCAKSQDILELIDAVREKVKADSGYTLECEVIYIPYEKE